MWYAADFETDASHFDDNGTPTETYVWAWGCGRCKDVGKLDDFQMAHGSDFVSFMKYVSTNCSKRGDIIFFHNLKFDGYFILYNLIEMGYGNVTDARLKDLDKGQFSVAISNMGEVYQILVCTGKGKRLTFRNSLLKIPFSIATIAKSLKIECKGDIDYGKRREEGAKLSKEDHDYLKRDVYILAYALKHICIDNNMKGMTIGMDCMDDFKSTIRGFDTTFPPLSLEDDKYVRQAYFGAVTYVKGGDHYAENGCTLDATSLYPSQMHGSSGNIYPYGEGIKFDGCYTPDPVHPVYVQRIMVTAKVKKDHLPFLNLRHMIFGDKEYMKECTDQVLTLTSVDLELLFQQYDIEEIQYIDGIKWEGKAGMFDMYINKYFKMKEDADKRGDPVMRLVSKLMLNNLYGKFASKPNRMNKIPSGLINDKIVYEPVTSEAKAYYLPVGIFVTAYGRKDLLKTVQSNWDYFDYCDTDSGHFHCEPEKLVNINIGRNKLGTWKIESKWDKAHFIRQKTYCEHIVSEGEPFYDFKCAGASAEVKKLLTWDNFKVGLGVYSDDVPRDKENRPFEHCKLRHVYCKGGIVLVPGKFAIRP